MKYVLDATTYAELLSEVADTVSPDDVIIVGKDKDIFKSSDIFYCVLSGKLYAATGVKELMDHIEAKVNTSIGGHWKVKLDDHYANESLKSAVAFMDGYASRSGISREQFLEHMVVATCDCDYEKCLGYQAVPIDSLTMFNMFDDYYEVVVDKDTDI